MGALRFVRDNLRWLAAGVLLAFLSSFGQTFVISVFAKGVMADFGLSPGNWGLLYSGATLLSAAAMLWAGALTDRLRTRALGTACLLGLALAALAFAINTSAVLLFPVVFLLRFLGQGLTVQTAMVAMARWFSANRGTAVSVASMGFIIGEAVLPVVFANLLLVTGWRTLWLGIGAFILLATPFLWLLLRHERTPRQMAEGRAAPGMGGRHWTRAEMLRHPLFWAAVPALMAPMICGTSIFFNQVHLAALKGWSHPALVALFPLYTAVAFATVMLVGQLVDRFGSGRLMPLIPLPVAAALVLLSGAEGLGQAALAMALVGVTFGMVNALGNTFWAEYYGTEHLGAIRSVGTSVFVLATALGPGLTGVLIDQGIELPAQYLGIAVFCLLAAALMALGLRSTPKVDVERP